MLLEEANTAVCLTFGHNKWGLSGRYPCIGEETSWVGSGYDADTLGFIKPITSQIRGTCEATSDTWRTLRKVRRTSEGSGRGDAFLVGTLMFSLICNALPYRGKKRNLGDDLCPC